MFTDSHMHFDSFAEKGSVDEILAAAAEADVSTIIAIGGSNSANKLAIELAEKHPQLFATVGYDRDIACEEWAAKRIDDLASHVQVKAIGETGLDYHYSAESSEQQIILFDEMLAIAAKHAKPAVVHSRAAQEDTLSSIKKYVENWAVVDQPAGVLHCFTEDIDFAKRLLDLNFMISFSGILTFASASSLREVAKEIPLDKILIETDAPYLAPTPYRGKTNQPAYVVQTAKCLAELKNISVEEVGEYTSQNAATLFQLS